MASDYILDLRSCIGHRRLLLPSVAAIIRDQQGRLLLQEKGNGEPWSLPAGGIEPGESPQQALRREVWEETGLTIVSMSLLAVFGGEGFRYTYPNRDQVEYTAIVFGCHVEGELDSSHDDETRSLAYKAREEMPPLALPYPMSLLFDQAF